MVDQNYYKKVLENELLARCKKNPSYSLNAFAKSLGLSQSSLSKIFSQQSKLSIEKAKHVVEMLKLDVNERDLFLISVSLHHDPEKMVLTSSLSKIIENPLYHLILNTIKLDDFQSDVHWIAGRVRSNVETVQNALNELLQVGLIKEVDGNIERAFPKTESHDQISPDSQKKFHRSVLSKAISSLDEYSSEQRNITGITMSIDPDKMDIAAKEITRFRQRMSKALESGKKTQVYHLEVGLFPL